MDKAMGTIIVALAIGGLLGFGGGYYYMQEQAKTAYASGMDYQQSITPQAATYATPTDLTFTWDHDEFDHSATVDGDGNVAADVSISHTLTILNDDTQGSGTLWVLMYDPIKGTKGLDTDLADALKYIEVTIDFGALSNIPLIKSDEYTTGYQMGSLPVGASYDVTVTVTLLENDHELFPAGESLDCSLYVYEPGANNVEQIDFTILT